MKTASRPELLGNNLGFRIGDTVLFAEETQGLIWQRIKSGLLIGIILFPLFGLLDYLSLPELAPAFFWYRIVCSFSLLGILGLLYTPFGREHPLGMAMAAYFLAGCAISLMIAQDGGYESSYYVGLIMVMVTFSVIMPLNIQQTLISGLLMLAVYVIPVFMVSEMDSSNKGIFINNVFFFIFFLVIIVVLSRIETQTRMREFSLRQDLQASQKQLAYYAHHLEDEVDKRAEELEKSELRYKRLYDHIIDMVILIDRQGRILKANQKFFQTMDVPEAAECATVFRFLPETEQDRFQAQVLNRLKQDKGISHVEFSMQSQNMTRYAVECNATGIELEDGGTAYQLVIRDITERKSLEKQLFDSYLQIQNARNLTILGLAKLAEYRDQNTGFHLERIREYTIIMARELAQWSKFQDIITRDYIEDLYQSSILHDIGKVGISDKILLKPSRLDPAEYEMVKQHTVLGGRIIEEMEARSQGDSFLSLGREIAYHHHEWWDGQGYPLGLKGDEIPISARLVAVADTYDVLTSKRCYKESFSHDKAKAVIVSNRGRQFDSDVVEAFLKHEKTFDQVRHSFFEERSSSQFHSS